MVNTKLENLIRNELEKINDIDSNKSLVETGTLYNFTVEENILTIILNIKDYQPSQYKYIKQLCKKYLSKLEQINKVNVIFTSESKNSVKRETNILTGIKPEGVKHIIAIASGKGGVGKSTIATNLAISLSKNNLKVGILDGDIYGPSQPRLMGINNSKPSTNENGKINPIIKYGIKCMSIGLLIDENRPIIWRGPMVQGALEQLLKDVDWGNLDILIVDMPPGTGDAQLTLSQRVKLSGAIIISTPQDIALIDAKKGLNMFRKVEVPIIGIIENMSFFECPSCHKIENIFGNGGAKKIAEELDVKFLGEIPLDVEIRRKSDLGEPVSLNHNFEVNSYFKDIAKQIVYFIKNEAIKFNVEPTIKME